MWAPFCVSITSSSTPQNNINQVSSRQGGLRKRYMDSGIQPDHSHSLCMFSNTQMTWTLLILVALLHPRASLRHLHLADEDLLPLVLPANFPVHRDSSGDQSLLRCDILLPHHLPLRFCVSMLACQFQLEWLGRRTCREVCGDKSAGRRCCRFEYSTRFLGDMSAYPWCSEGPNFNK